MRFLLLNQFFWPDAAATSQLLTDLARALDSEGHEITAVCAGTGGYSSGKQSGDAIVGKIHRVRCLGFGRSRVGRVLSYLSFYVLAALYACFTEKQDVVVTLTTPPLLSLLGTLLKTLRGTQHFIWEMDLYPDVAVDLEYFKAGSLADRVTGALADFSRMHADGIIALGECMKERLMRRDIPESRIFVADNWADSTMIQPIVRTGDVKQLNVLYSGNIGLAHEFDTILQAIESLQEETHIRFLFAGGGGRRNEIEAFIACTGVCSIGFLPFVQRDGLSSSLASGDIGLVTQKNSCCGSVVPSKVYGLLAAGRPVLYIGPAEATPARIIRRFGCGWHVEVGQVDRIRNLLLHLAANRHEIAVAGDRARVCLLEHFDLPHGVRRITDILMGYSMLAVAAPSSVLPVPELIGTSSTQVA